jgi:hypothetical protein
MTEYADGNEHTVERLRRFGDEAASANRLELLKAIEETLDALALERRRVSTLIDNGEMLIESITKSSTMVFDQDGELTQQLERIERGLREESIPTLIAKRNAAYADPQIRGDYCDGIVSAYDELISRMEKLHDTTVNLRWAVMEHDADLEKPIGDEFQSPADLLRSILG